MHQRFTVSLLFIFAECSKQETRLSFKRSKKRPQINFVRSVSMLKTGKTENYAFFDLSLLFINPKRKTYIFFSPGGKPSCVSAPHSL